MTKEGEGGDRDGGGGTTKAKEDERGDIKGVAYEIGYQS